MKCVNEVLERQTVYTLKSRLDLANAVCSNILGKYGTINERSSSDKAYIFPS